MAKTKSRKSSTIALTGCQDPSVRIAPKYDKSDGMTAARLLKAGGLILDPWQSEIMDDWMALTPAGKWLCKTCGGSVPRQNGKTGLVAGRGEAGMMLYNEQVLYNYIFSENIQWQKYT